MRHRLRASTNEGCMVGVLVGDLWHWEHMAGDADSLQALRNFFFSFSSMWGSYCGVGAWAMAWEMAWEYEAVTMSCTGCITIIESLFWQLESFLVQCAIRLHQLREIHLDSQLSSCSNCSKGIKQNHEALQGLPPPSPASHKIPLGNSQSSEAGCFSQRGQSSQVRNWNQLLPCKVDADQCSLSLAVSMRSALFVWLPRLIGSPWPPCDWRRRGRPPAAHATMRSLLSLPRFSFPTWVFAKKIRAVQEKRALEPKWHRIYSFQDIHLVHVPSTTGGSVQGVLSSSHALVIPIGRLKRLNAILVSPCFLSSPFLRGLQAVINTHGGYSISSPLLKQKISYELSPRWLCSRSKWGHWCSQAVVVTPLKWCVSSRPKNGMKIVHLSQRKRACESLTPRCWETCRRAWGGPPS